MAPSPLQTPGKVELKWGTDTLIVEDPAWVEKIIRALHDNSGRDWDEDDLLCDPYCGPNDSGTGYRPPVVTDATAMEALSAFLGLQLPVALSIRWRWDTEVDAFSAVATRFHRLGETADIVTLSWAFKGHRLNKDHSVGSPIFKNILSDSYGGVDRRLLTGKWVPWSFAGAFERDDPAEDPPSRTFMLDNGSIRQPKSEADIE